MTLQWFHTTNPNAEKWAEQQISTSLSHVIELAVNTKKGNSPLVQFRLLARSSFHLCQNKKQAEPPKMGCTHINVLNEPKQSVFLDVSSPPCWRRPGSQSVCLGAGCCQDVQLTLTWKKNPDRIKKNFFLTCKHISHSCRGGWGRAWVEIWRSLINVRGFNRQLLWRSG